MKNSKGLLSFILLLCLALPLTKTYAQTFLDLYGELRRTTSCGSQISIKNAIIKVFDSNNNLFYFTQSFDGGYFYGFPEDVTGPITVTPVYNQNLTNGVTTYDLVLISRHYLGVSPLTDPYALLAADADANGVIDGTDVLYIRRVILLISLNYFNYNPRVNSWRFVPQYYLNNSTFNNAFYADPFSATYQGTKCYTPCGTNSESYMDKLKLDVTSNSQSPWIFRPFKVGDVDCSAVNNMIAQPVDQNTYVAFNNSDVLTSNVANNRYSIRTASPIALQNTNEKTIVLKVKNTARFVAFQMGLRYLTDKLSINHIEKGD